MTSPRFTEPAGFEFAHFRNAKGADIRYGMLKAGGESKGTIVIGPGFRENIEKYFEVIRDMHERGFDVYAMDWRGQGGSERYIKGSQKAHHEGYDEQIDTLDQLMREVVTPQAKKPLIYMGHSMGGHIGLRYLKEHAGVFDSAVLSSPMLDINTKKFPKFAARLMAQFARAAGLLKKYVPDAGDWHEEPFGNNTRTNDPARFEAEQAIMRDNEDLRIGWATYGWVYQTFRSVDVLNDKDYLKSITTPILMGVAGDERWVDLKAEQRAAELMPNVRKVEFPGAQHELFMAVDKIRNVWMSAIDSFLSERVQANIPTSAPRQRKPGLAA